MSDIDFAIVADDIMTVQAFLLRQVLSQYYVTALWFPKDLERYAPELARVPRVVFVGPNQYTHHFARQVDIHWRDLGAFWGFKGRTAVILAEDRMEHDRDRIRTLDLAVADARKAARVERVTNRLSPGLRAAASFYDPLMAARTLPPMMMSADAMVERLQYSVAVGGFLHAGFDRWCWGHRITPDDRDKRIKRLDRAQ